MKKINLFRVALLMLVLSTSSVTKAQDLGSILSGVTKAVTSNQATAKNIVGTWQYSKPACTFDSDNILATAGGEIASEKIEEKMAQICAQAGLKNTTCKYVFDSNGKYSCTVNNRVSSGTYTFDEKNKKINLVTTTGIKFNGKVVMNGNTMQLLFSSDKLLKLLQTMSSAAGNTSVNSTMNVLTSLSSQYNGMNLGFEMKKK